MHLILSSGPESQSSGFAHHAWRQCAVIEEPLKQRTTSWLAHSYLPLAASNAHAKTIDWSGLSVLHEKQQCFACQQLLPCHVATDHKLLVTSEA